MRRLSFRTPTIIIIGGMKWSCAIQSTKYQIRRRRRAARSLTSQGRAEPLCARITGLNREVSEGKADL